MRWVCKVDDRIQKTVIREWHKDIHIDTPASPPCAVRRLHKFNFTMDLLANFHLKKSDSSCLATCQHHLLVLPAVHIIPKYLKLHALCCSSNGILAGTSISPRSYFTAKSQIATAPIAADGIQLIVDAFSNQTASGYWQAHAQQVHQRYISLLDPCLNVYSPRLQMSATNVDVSLFCLPQCYSLSWKLAKPCSAAPF